MELNELIKKFRIEKNLSQRQFALACGLSNSYISMVEKNRNPKTGLSVIPSVSTLDKIAKGMNMSLRELLLWLDNVPVDICIGCESDTIKEKSVMDYESNFDEQEVQLLNFYRQLSSEQKVFLLVQLEALVKRNQGSEETSF